MALNDHLYDAVVLLLQLFFLGVFIRQKWSLNKFLWHMQCRGMMALYSVGDSNVYQLHARGTTGLAEPLRTTELPIWLPLISL